MKRNIAYLFGTALVLLALYVSQGVKSDFIPAPYDLSAAPGDNADLNGHGWSSTIGWISMNCLTGNTGGTSRCAATPYKVTINTNANGNPMLLRGDAWNDSIGWITFDVGATYDSSSYNSVPAGIGGVAGRGGCPLNPTIGVAPGTPDCRARLQKNAAGEYDFVGWVRGCSVFDDSDCTGTPTPLSVRGGWDGWISLSCHNTGTCPPTGTAYGLDAVANGGFRPVYSWGSDLVGWMSWRDVSFTPPCSNVGEECSIDKTSHTYTDQFCATTVTMCDAGNTCFQNTPTDAMCVVVVPDGTFEATPARVRKGNEVTLSWDVSNVGSCTIAALPALPGSQVVPTVTVDEITATANSTAVVTINNGTTFTLTCSDVDGGNQTVMDTREVNVLPSLEYI